MQTLLPILLLLLLSMLSACTLLTHDKPQLWLQRKEKPIQPVSQCGGMLSYYTALRVMSAKELDEELSRLRENVTHAQNTCDQLRLVMLLGMSKYRFKKYTEAEKLLKDIFEKEGTLAIQDKQFALLLADEIQWQKKTQSNQEALEKQLKKERAASLNLLERLAEAQSKLKELKSIDKNITAREQEISRPSTDKIPHEPK